MVQDRFARNTRRTTRASNAYNRQTRRSGNRGRFFGALIVLFLKLILAAALFAGVGYGLVYLYRMATTSNYFVIKDVEISGNERLEYHDVIKEAGLEPGLNSLSVSIDDIEMRLKKNPWIKKVSVTRKLPDRVQIDIEEYTPKLWVLADGKMQYADINGKVIAPVEPVRFVSLPILEVEKGVAGPDEPIADILQKLNAAGLPVQLDAASWIHVGKTNGIEIYFENTRLRLGVGLDELSVNLERLARVLQDLNRRGELGLAREAGAYGPNVWVLLKEPLSNDS